MKHVLEIPVKLQQRVAIHFCQKLGITLTLTNVFLRQVFGGQTLCERSIRRWYKAFENGRTRITNFPRAHKIWRGRSLGNIQAVKHLVEQDRWIGLCSLSAETSLTYGTVFRILKDDLGLIRKSAKLVPKMLDNRQRNLHLTLCELWKCRVELDPGYLKRVVTVDESWVYMYELETKQQSTQWLPKGAPRPIKFHQTRATGSLGHYLF